MNIWQKLKTTKIQDNNNELLDLLKKEYNHNLVRMYKAEEFFNNDSVSVDKALQYVDGFNEVISNLSILQANYREITGVEMDIDTKFKGFEI